MLKEEREKWVEIRKNDKKPTLLDEYSFFAVIKVRIVGVAAQD